MPSDPHPAAPPPADLPPPSDPPPPADLPPPSDLPPSDLPPPVLPPNALAEPPQRLHPFSIIRGVRLRSLLGAVPALAFVAADNELPGIVLLFGVVLITFVIGVVRVLAWQRHTYEFREGRIVERSGIISRTERALEVERIQQVDVERTVLDRVVGTCELRLETAADSGEAELSLRVVSVEEAQRLRGLLARRVGAAAGPPHDGAGSAPEETHGIFVAEDTDDERAGEQVLVSVPLTHVVLAAVTGPRLLAVPAAIAVLFGFLAENAQVDRVVETAGDAVSGIGVAAAVLLALLVILGSILVAAVTGVLRDGGFTMALRGSDLRVRRGLTTTRSATVPLRRVQRVTVKRRWLQDALGYASVTVHSAGGGGGNDGGPSSGLDRSLTVPLLPKGDVAALVNRVLGITDVPPLEPHPRAALRRSIVRSLLAALVPAAVAGGAAVVLDLRWLWTVAALVLMAAVAAGALTYRRTASGADSTAVAGRTGLFGTTTELSPLRKTQGTTVTSSFFQRRLGLASLKVHVAGPAGGIELVDVAADRARALAPDLV